MFQQDYAIGLGFPATLAMELCGCFEFPIFEFRMQGDLKGAARFRINFQNQF